MQFLDLPWWQQVSRGLMTWLSEFIYSIMGFFYELFNIVTKTNILSSKDVQPIYQRMTMILTIVMVFYITFQFVKYVVQPDNMTDKEKGAGNIVYKMVIVIVLIAFVPKIFEGAYKVQNVIINKNVIPKVILGPQASIDEENLGPSFAASVFSMFYYVEAENANKDCYDGVTCHEIVANNLSDLQKGEKLKSLSFGINETDDSDKPLITFEFHGILAVAVGAVIVWILMLYCIDVGTRWAQLLYLQLIAPIPILGYMSPKKDGIFQKWAKQCFTTYLDLFLRVAIINIILLLCHTLIQSKITGGIVPEGTTGLMSTLVYIVLIIGVMMFAHKAPKMISELFPKGGAASGNFGLKAKDRGLKGASRVFGAAAGGAVGAVVGAGAGLAQGFRRAKKLDSNAKWYQKAAAGMYGATRGGISGAIGGAGRGIASGAKKGNIIKNVSSGAKNQLKASQRFGNREENGYGFMDQIGDRAKAAVNARSRTEVLEDKKAPLKRKQDAYSSLTKANDNIRDYAWKKAQDGKSSYITNYRDAEGREKRYMEKTAAELGITEPERLKLLKEATDDKKKYKDLATNDYIDSEKQNDKGLQNMFENRDADLENYNHYASTSAKISDKTTDEIKYKDENGNEHTIPAGTKISDLNATALDAYTKMLKNREAEVGREISKITAEQEAIKRQTSGSGINEGKK